MKFTTSFLALFASVSAFAQSAYVLDAGASSIVRVDVQRGTVEAKAALPFHDDPTDIVTTPDGKRLVVLSHGTAAIVDAATLTASQPVNLGVVDQFEAVSNDLGVVLRKGGRHTTARAAFVALDTLDVVATVDLTGQATELVAIPGSGYVYAVEANAVDVVSIADRKLAATLSVGRNARLGGVDEATQSLFVTATDDKKNGMLYVIRGASIAGSSSTGAAAPEAFRLTADGKRAFVGNSRGVTQLTLGPQLATQSTAPLYSGITANSLTVVDSASTPDGRRVFLLMQQNGKCCMVATIDTEAGKRVGSVQAGRSSRRVVQALFAVAATAASYSSGRADARAHGRSTFMYSIYSPAAAKNPRGAFAFGPDTKSLYVLDANTDAVTVIDVDSGKRVVDIDAPDKAQEVMLVGGKTIVAVGEGGLALIDSASNKSAEKLETKGDLHDVAILPDGTMALALSKGDIAIIDGRTTKVAAHVAGLIDPVAVAFAHH